MQLPYIINKQWGTYEHRSYAVGTYDENGTPVTVYLEFHMWYVDEVIEIVGSLFTSVSDEYQLADFQKNDSIAPVFNNPPIIEINNHQYEAEIIGYHDDELSLHINKTDFNWLYDKISISIFLDMDMYEVEDISDDYILGLYEDLEPASVESAIYLINKTVVISLLLFLIILCAYLLYRFNSDRLHEEMPDLRTQLVFRYLLIPYTIITSIAIIYFNGVNLVGVLLAFAVIPILFEFFYSGYRSKPIEIGKYDAQADDKSKFIIDQGLFNRMIAKIVIVAILALSTGIVFGEMTDPDSIW
jgi:hypothetical protein